MSNRPCLEHGLGKPAEWGTHEAGSCFAAARTDRCGWRPPPGAPPSQLKSQLFDVGERFRPPSLMIRSHSYGDSKRHVATRAVIPRRTRPAVYRNRRAASRSARAHPLSHPQRIARSPRYELKDLGRAGPSTRMPRIRPAVAVPMIVMTTHRPVRWRRAETVLLDIGKGNGGSASAN